MSEGAGEDQILHYFLRDELRVINSSLPRKRKTLEELLKEEIPYVLTHDGGSHMFRKSELVLAKKTLGDEARNLNLPILLEFLPTEKETVAETSDPVAIKLIAKLLGIPEVKPLRLYPTHLKELRSKIGTLIIYLLSPKTVSSL
ncbi:MAG: DUF61 family protein [Desulfurococcales archaeon]|nr:DUF61 family protein [Desulfurococcales archaeon]